jgi:di/tricarboxylate transporter
MSVMLWLAVGAAVYAAIRWITEADGNRALAATVAVTLLISAGEAVERMVS